MNAPDRFLVLSSLALTLMAAPALAVVDDVPIGGFQPWVAFSLTDEFSNENQGELFFVADVDSSYNASHALPTNGSPKFAVGLLDSGAQVNLLKWQTMLDFDLPGAGFTGTEFIPAVGVSGTELLRVEDPLGIFAAGLQHAASGTPGTPGIPGSGGAPGSSITVPDTSAVRGLRSVAPATAPIDSALPNVVGLPMMSTHTTVIRNSQPQFVTHEGSNFRAPSVDFLPKGAAIPSDFSRRAALSLDVNAAFGTTEPLYVFNTNNIISGIPLHEDPATPTAVGGAFFTDIDLANDGTTKTAEVFFDTGAQVSVVNELLAAQLGFDVVNDTPEFTVPVLGVGGTITEVPGFVVDSLTLPAVGGNFTATNVPVIVLTEVPNPLGTGILDGILGTNVFWDRDLVVDPAGNRLWISDPVVEQVSWNGGLGDYDTGAKWSVNRRPVVTDVVSIVGHANVDMDTDAQVFRMQVGGSAAATPSVLDVGAKKLEVFTDLRVEINGTVHTAAGGVVSTQQIEVNNGGTLSGAGTYTGDTLNNHGTVRPSQGSAMTLVGTYQMGEDGRHEYAGVKLTVEGGALLTGELDLFAATNGPRPTAYGPAVTILEADSVVGMFGEVAHALYGDGFALAVTYLADAVQATVALYGDANLSQQVEQGDLDAVLQNWGNTAAAEGVSWVTGDLNGNGQVEQGDLDAVLQNWGDTTAPDLRGSTVPEPAAALAMLTLLGMRCFRRRAA